MTTAVSEQDIRYLLELAMKIYGTPNQIVMSTINYIDGIKDGQRLAEQEKTEQEGKDHE